MKDVEEANSWRAEIALRNRRYALESRERKISMAVFGLILGILYSLGVYRVWAKDDTRWWPVAVPAGLAIAFLLPVWIGGMHRPIPLVLNLILLVLVPIRRRAVEAVPIKPFESNRLRGPA